MRALVLALALLAALGVLLYCAGPARADEVTVRMAPAPNPLPEDADAAVLCAIDCGLVAADGSVANPEQHGNDWTGWYGCALVDHDNPLAPLVVVVAFEGDLCVRVVANDVTGQFGWSLASADQKVVRVEPAP